VLERWVCGAAVCLFGLLSACDVVWPEERGDPEPFDGSVPQGDPDAGLSVRLDARTDAPFMQLPRPEAGADAVDASAQELPLTAGDHALTLVHDGVQRRYLVHVPLSYDPAQPVPLVVDFHGFSSSAEQQKGLSGWVQTADQHGFLLVHPQGVGNSWNGGSLCCGEAMTRRVDDRGFARALVQRLSTLASVDMSRVYATGLSNGGAMAHRLACEASDLFAAVAPVSMSNSVAPCSPPRGIAVLMFRATGDTLVSYDSGKSFPTAAADLAHWRVQNGCLDEPTHEGPCQTYAQCRDGAEVGLCTITTTAQDMPWGGHVLYPQALRENISVSQAAWQMFERHVLTR
jgi:polyhydroxybutyrate depolymerase